jgi:uncharacterized coiled-coil protein SlyX
LCIDGDLFTDVMHICNIMYDKYIKFLDWLSGGMIFDLDFQANAYKEVIEMQNKRIAGLHDRLDANRMTIDELKAVLTEYKEKEAKIAKQKRESYHRRKQK